MYLTLAVTITSRLLSWDRATPFSKPLWVSSDSSLECKGKARFTHHRHRFYDHFTFFNSKFRNWGQVRDFFQILLFSYIQSRFYIYIHTHIDIYIFITQVTWHIYIHCMSLEGKLVTSLWIATICGHHQEIRTCFHNQSRNDKPRGNHHQMKRSSAGRFTMNSYCFLPSAQLRNNKRCFENVPTCPL